MLHLFLFVLVCLVATMVWFVTWSTMVTAISSGHIQGLRHRWTRTEHPTRFWLTLGGWITLAAFMLLIVITALEYSLARLRLFDGS